MSHAPPGEPSESKERAFLRGIVNPSTTAVLTMELQNGIVTGEALFPALVEEVQRVGVLDTVRRVGIQKVSFAIAAAQPQQGSQ